MKILRRSFSYMLYATIRNAKKNDEGQVAGQDTAQVAGQVTVQDILDYCSVSRSRREIQTFCKLSGRNNFNRLYLKPLLESGQLRMTIPEKPNSKNQKYIAVKLEKK